MAAILGSNLLSFAGIAGRDSVHDDDMVDQLNHWATVGLLTALAVGTGAKQFVGTPISCWLPAEYKKGMYQSYANNYCWISHMYYVPFSNPIPLQEEDRWDVDVSFYRWVTVMFLVQALLFKLPNILWVELRSYSGLNVEKVVSTVQDSACMAPDDRQQQLSHAAVFLHDWLKSYTMYRFSAAARFRDQVSSVLFCFGKRSGTYLTGLYMFIKILYVTNIICQFFLLSAFLGLDYWSFGAEAISVVWKEGRWQDHYNFPRVGLCDYKIRQISNVQTFSVQCVLSINLFLEKMYLLLWFWLLGLLAASVVSLGLWFVDNAFTARSETFMFRFARTMGVDTAHANTLFRLFIFTHLRRDGVFVLRMVGKNTSSMLCLELVKEMWKVFQQELRDRDPAAPLPSEDDGADEDEADSLPDKPPLD